MKALQQLNNLPERKEQIKEFARQGVDQILNGEYSALELKFRFDAIKKAVEMILDHAAVNDVLLMEAHKFEGQDYKGGKVALNRRKTWNYEKCGDPTYTELSNTLEMTKRLVKKQEDFLRSLTAPVSDLDGNIINPATYSETEFVTFK